MEHLHALVYISSASKELSHDQLTELLAISRTNNAEKNITGVLVYCGGNILQVLEGQKNDLHKLYGKIEKDDRHKHCIVLQDRAKEVRDFNDWSMGFKSVTKDQFNELEGYFDLRNHVKTQQQGNSTFIKELLDDFITQNR